MVAVVQLVAVTGLRAKWPSAASLADKALMEGLQNPDEEVNGDLAVALEGVVGQSKCYSDIVEWLEHTTECNQKSMAVISKAFLKYVKPNSQDRVDLILKLMGWVARNSLATAFPAEYAVLSGLFLSACCRSLGSFRLNGMTSDRFVVVAIVVAVVVVVAAFIVLSAVMVLRGVREAQCPASDLWNLGQLRSHESVMFCN